MILADIIHAAADQFDPNDGIDLVGMLIVAAPAIIAAIGVIILNVITVRGQKRVRDRARRTDAQTAEIHEQTVNDHRGRSNMRDDLDEMRDMLKDMSDRQLDQTRDIRGLRHDIGELRGEDRAAHANHTDLVRRLNAFIRREHPDADPL